MLVFDGNAVLNSGNAVPKSGNALLSNENDLLINGNFLRQKYPTSMTFGIASMSQALQQSGSGLVRICGPGVATSLLCEMPE